MLNPNEIKTALERLASGKATAADQQAVQQALQNKQIVLAGGERSLAIDGNVTDAVFIIGDNNVVFKGEAADTIRQALAAYFAPKPGCAPPVPSLVIGRDEALEDLKKRLGIISTAEKPGALQVLTAVRGWPGVGKTTIAAALAHDADITKAFPDGVLWLSLGQKPNLLTEMATWGRALGTDDLLRAPTLKEATTLLTSLLRRKRLLLIVDDVWETAHAAPFQQARGSDCALLVTTRESGIAESLALPEAIYQLPVLTEEYALKLLNALAPAVIKEYPNESRELVRALECLPLALHVAGHMLHAESRLPWGVKDLLAELQEGKKIIESKAPADRMDYENETIPTVAALLKKSTDRLDGHARDCFAFLGAFAPKPATFDLAAMQAVWMVDDAKPVARELTNRGLLEPVGNRFQMHALLVAHARALCEE